MSRFALVPLRHVARLVYGEALPSESRDEGDVPVYGSNGPAGWHSVSNTLGPVIVIGRKGSQGKIQFSNEPVFAIDTTYFVDRECTKANLRWLYYVLSTVDLPALTQDVGVPGLAREAAYAARVPVPTASHQRAIADYLDAETARIDVPLSARRRQVALLEARKWAALVALVTGSRPDRPEPSGKLTFPAAWTPTRIKHLAQPLQSGDWGDDPTGDRDVLVVRAADFDRARLRVDAARLPLRHVDSASGRQRTLLPGDLVLEKSGGGPEQPVGAAVLFDLAVPAIPSNFAARIRAYDGVDPEFLCFVFAAMYHLGLNQRSIKQTTGIQNLDVGAFMSESWAIPPLSEQVQLGAEVSRVFTEVGAFQSAIGRQIDLLIERRQALITAAVTGQIEIPGVAA